MTDSTRARSVDPQAPVDQPLAGRDDPGPGAPPDAEARGLRPAATELPTWPVAALFVAFPLWWVLGLVDLVWIPVAGVMALYLFQCRAVKGPRGLGLWLFFLAWTAGSAIMLRDGGDLIAFAYRFLLYVSATVLLLYVYNARRRLTERFVAGCLTAWWLTTVAGGYLGLLFPTAVIRTPMSYLLPGDLVSNPLVNHMVIRRLTQFNPDSFLEVAPRPSAPFLYTNNWGNVYSLLLPFVIVYLLKCRGERRFVWLALALPLSAVPAFLTLNRGMFLGLGLSLLYVAVRLAFQRRFKAIVALGALTVVAAAVFAALPVSERLSGRLSDSAENTSNDTRASLYLQALSLVPDSPVFGLGGPVEGNTGAAAPVGTQGQLWMLLVSHGPVATAAFVGWFLLAAWLSRRRTDAAGLAAGTVLLVGCVELVYYGLLPNGLPIMAVASALALRGPDPRSPGDPPEGVSEPATGTAVEPRRHAAPRADTETAQVGVGPADQPFVT